MSEETKIKLDPNNYRNHPDANKRLIRQSLTELGAGRSILIDNEGYVISGNGTYEQAKKLKIPVKVIKTDGKELIAVQRVDLKPEDENRRKMAVVDNSAGDLSKFDLPKLRQDFSIEALADMGIGGLELPEIQENYLEEEPEILSYDENVFFPSKNKYDIPELRADMLYDGPIDDICYGTNDVLDPDKTYLCLYGQHKISETARGNIIGFFVDDQRFEVVWNDAVVILEKFKKIQPKAIMTPNFSLWVDEPLPYQIMAWYKTQWCGRYWQEAGFKIVPTLNWAGTKSYDFCFLGIPQGAPVVAIQCRTVRTAQERRRFVDGILKAKEVLDFKKCVCYGEGIKEFSDFLSGIDYVTIRNWNSKKGEANK